MALSADLIDIANRLADAAGPIVRSRFRDRSPIDDKADASPVTAADREAEAAMRAILVETCPGHGIFGEEYGRENEAAEFVWVLDPIDGTKSFATGKPIFGTLIGLARAGKPVLGIIDQPVLGERWLGAAGRATTFNGEAAATRACGSLAAAWSYATSPHMFEGDDFERYSRLAGAVKHPLYGSDCYAYGLLASGFADIVCEAGLKPYDYCAVVPVIEGAGGVISDWAGEALSLASDGRVLAAGDAAVHAEALSLLAD